MQGILVLDKPEGFTSFDAVAKLRGICNTRRIGHSGTLDPMATGVLPVFIGGAAKAVDLQKNHDKTYIATMQLGLSTDTGDITGTVLRTAPVPPSIDAKAVQAVLQRFVGAGEQIPPMYSAVKIDGQPLYKAARAGKTVERKPRPVVIHSITLLECPDTDLYTLEISCGKGTYVRVLLEEIGEALGCPATMQALRRTQAGAYTLAQAVSFSQLQAAKDAGTLETMLQSVETVFAHLPALTVDEETALRLKNGAPTYRRTDAPGTYRVQWAGEFLGIAVMEGGIFKAQKLFCERK